MMMSPPDHMGSDVDVSLYVGWASLLLLVSIAVPGNPSSCTKPTKAYNSVTAKEGIIKVGDLIKKDQVCLSVF